MTETGVCTWCRGRGPLLLIDGAETWDGDQVTLCARCCERARRCAVGSVPWSIGSFTAGVITGGGLVAWGMVLLW